MTNGWWWPDVDGCGPDVKHSPARAAAALFLRFSTMSDGRAKSGERPMAVSRGWLRRRR